MTTSWSQRLTEAQRMAREDRANARSYNAWVRTTRFSRDRAAQATTTTVNVTNTISTKQRNGRIYTGVYQTVGLGSVQDAYAWGHPEGASSTKRDTSATRGQTFKTYSFWATPPRPAFTPFSDSLLITLGKFALANRLTCKISQYPARVFLQYFDEFNLSERYNYVSRRFGTQAQGSWKYCVDSMGRPIEVTVRQSVPSRILDQTDFGLDGNGKYYGGYRSYLDFLRNRKKVQVNVQESTHPQHQGAGHWINVDLRFPEVNARQFRLVFDRRVPDAVFPVNAQGEAVSYSMAVKDWNLSYVADQVPTGMLDGDTFGSGEDLQGGQIEYSVQKMAAANLAVNSQQYVAGVPTDDQEGFIGWRSEPQPLPNAVVNLYLDARTRRGEPSIVDRIEIDPKTQGVSCNLYYTEDRPDPAGQPSEQRLAFPLVRATDRVEVRSGLLSFGQAGSYLDIDNAAVQWDATRDWWLGLRLRFSFASTDTQTRTVLATRDVRINWQGGQFVLLYRGLTIKIPAFEFVAEQEMSIIAALQGSEVTLMVDGYNRTQQIDPLAQTRTVPSEMDGYLRLGADLVTSGHSEPSMKINHLTIKISRVTSLPDLMAEFSTRPDLYIYPSTVNDGQGEDVSRLAGTILRLLPDRLDDDPVSAFYGGPPNGYDRLIWKPITRDYRLVKGSMRFAAVKAAAFKMEFTNLQAEHYASPVVMNRRVRLHTDATKSRSLPQIQDAVVEETGARINTELSPIFAFRDNTALPIVNRPGYSGYTPTEAYYIDDPEVQKQAAKQNPLLGMVPISSAQRAPQFVSTGVHLYDEVEVEHVTKIGYFVGLNAVRLYRTRATRSFDTGAYSFSFLDDDALTLDTALDAWVWDQRGGLRAPPILPQGSATMTSQTLRSKRNIRGIQFATQQSAPAQLLANPDFADGTAEWEPIGGCTLTAADPAEIREPNSQTVRVTRYPFGAFWNQMQEQYPTWDSIVEQNAGDGFAVTWDDLVAETGVGPAAGLRTVETFTPSQTGSLHAAGRLYAPEALSAPVSLQIVTADGAVVAESTRVIRQGMNEWTVSYALGDQMPVVSGIGEKTWAELDGQTWLQVESLGAWGDIDTVSSAYQGPLRVQMVQAEPTLDVWYVDSIAAFNDPITWEFSNDSGQTWVQARGIRNDPRGCLIFPTQQPDRYFNQEGTDLRWRVRTSRPNVRVSALVVRPIYASLPGGVVPAVEGIGTDGPNLSPTDQYARIEDDPAFKGWNKPIPQFWYYGYNKKIIRGTSIEQIPEKVKPKQFLTEVFIQNNSTSKTPMTLTEDTVQT